MSVTIKFPVGATQYKILAGPSEEHLFEALRKFTPDPLHLVRFTIGSTIVNIRINGILAEGGAFQWKITGFANDHPTISGNFTGNYNTQKRTGYITFHA